MLAVIVFSGLHWAMMPPSRVETIDPSRLQLSGEFVEDNLGSAVQPDGSVMVRFIAQQYSFTPQCLLVPADTPITIRTTSADVVHGLLVTDTNINTMVVPGYVATLNTQLRPSRRSHHAVPRVLRLRPSDDVGAREGDRQSHLLRDGPTITEAELCSTLSDSFSRISGSPSSRF